MSAVLRSLRTLTSRVLRLAAALAAAAQIAVNVAPVAEGKGGPDARAHVEAAGLSLHHTHDAAACPACAAQHFVGRPVAALTPWRDARRASPHARVAPLLHAALAASTHHPR